VRLHAREPVGDGLFLGPLERLSVVVRAGDQICQGVQQQGFLLGEIDALQRFHVQDAVQMVAVEYRQGHRRVGIRQNRLRAALRMDGRAEGGRFAGSCHLPDQAGIQRDATSQGAAALTTFRRDDQLAGGVIEDGQANVVVRKTILELPGDFR